MGKKRATYDDDALVEMIAEGQLTYKTIGERVGISEGQVKKIALGQRRKDLARRLWDAEDGILNEARRIGSRYARNLIMEQVRLGLTGEGEPARRAREFLLKFTMSARPRRKDLPEERQPRPDWMIEDLRALGDTPWEDQLAAEMQEEVRDEEKATGNRQQATGDGPLPVDRRQREAVGGNEGAAEAMTAFASMAAVAVMPAGETGRG